ncbi:hypothetical protein [Microbacterium gorillae]|uniref:hypothetical protein n=1 Tax=Microbacterium gorillae TaxID=1231063 RepID=UPI003D98A27A
MTKLLDAALAAYQLTREDLPGIEDAWAREFGDLDKPMPETARDVIVRLHPKFASWTELNLDDFTPQPDGGLAVRVLGQRADGLEDYEWVSVAGEDVVAFLMARESYEERTRLLRLQHCAEAYSTGAHPIWWLLASGNVPQRRRGMIHERDAAVAQAARLTERAARIDALQHTLETRTLISDAAEGQFPFAVGYARGIAPLSCDEKHRVHERAVRVDTVNDIARDLTKYIPLLAQLQNALDAAHALPDGALREFLIGERDPKTYSATEGTGRRKRQVKHSYVPVSDLVREHRNASDGHARANARAEEMLERLGWLRTENDAALTEAEERQLSATAELAWIWGAGWPGEHELPAPRQNASAEEAWND